jgi:uncharacterized protein YcfJ
MKMLTKIVLPFIGLAAGMSVASAADFEDFARVVNVAPQVEQVNQPQKECRTDYEQVEHQDSRGVGGAIVGGLAGGLLGNQVGRGHGRTAATAAGAIAGALVGDRMENSNDTTTVSERPVERCQLVEHWVSRNNGYAVTYEYHGHTYTSILPYDPGQRIKLHISLTPQI